jgi:signal peptidase
LKISNINRRFLVNVILIALVIVAVFGFDPVLKVVTGCTRMVVKGTSMLPTLKEGDLVFIREVNQEKILFDEIIVFDKYVLEPGDPDIRDIRIDPPWIHRVMETEVVNGESYFKTKGDNNQNHDMGWIPGSLVIGKLVFNIPFLGYLSINPFFRTLNLIIITSIIFLIFYMEIKDKKRVN